MSKFDKSKKMRTFVFMVKQMVTEHNPQANNHVDAQKTTIVEGLQGKEQAGSYVPSLPKCVHPYKYVLGNVCRKCGEILL